MPPNVARPRLLPRSFYARDAAAVARELLGKVLEGDVAGTLRRARITETEAYLGPHDAASHSRHGPTARNRSMFGPPGRAYVYFIYGVHHCLNVVTGAPGSGSAVLVRAAEPLDGWDARLAGPGLLARAYGLTRAHDGTDLVRGPLRIRDGPAPASVLTTPRIGVAYAGAWAARPLRFLAHEPSPRARRAGMARPRPATSHPLAATEKQWPPSRLRRA